MPHAAPDRRAQKNRATWARSFGPVIVANSQLVILDFHDLFAAIGATLLTDTMRNMVLSTAFALYQVVQGQRMVSAPSIAARFGHLSFR